MFFKRTGICLLLIFRSFLALSQVVPFQDSRINYTQVYFEEQLVRNAAVYELSVWPAAYPDSITRTTHTLPAFHMDLLNWGQSYKWNVKAFDKEHALISESAVHAFAIVPLRSCVLNSATELHIRTNKQDKHAGGLILVDYTRSAYDRNGRAVWTLPDIPGIVDSNVTQIRDLKLTGDNTITFLTPKHAVEIDLDGKVLWKAPENFLFKGEKVDYHHDLQKTKRGTYLVLGKRKIARRLVGTYTEAELAREFEAFLKDGKAYMNTEMHCLLEFDKAGKLVWYWDAGDHLSDEDLAYKKDLKDNIHFFSSHANAFSENAEGTTVYVGFRDLSRIVRVDKKTRKVTMTYGEKFPSGHGQMANRLFRRQHSAMVTHRNSILIFNNNDAASERTRPRSEIIEFRDNTTREDSLLLWRFPLSGDSAGQAWSSSGGNVTELPNGNILLCGGVLNRILEVTRQKEVVWDTWIMSRFKKDQSLQTFPQYRASWLPAIYMHHFVAYTEKAGEDSLALHIFNTGNADDSYRLEIITGPKKMRTVITPPVAPGTESHSEITLKKMPVRMIRIVSVKSGEWKEMKVDIK